MNRPQLGGIASGIALGALLLMTASAALASAAPSSAQFSVVQGSVDVQYPSGAQVPAVENAPLLPGDYVTTGRHARADVSFGDGATALRLAGDVQARLIDANGGIRHVQLAGGTVEASVLRSDDGAIEIDTPSVTVRSKDVGDYRVTISPDGTTYVTARSGRAQIVTPNQTYTLDPGKTLVATGSAGSPQITYQTEVADDSFDAFNTARDAAENATIAVQSPPAVPYAVPVYVPVVQTVGFFPTCGYAPPYYGISYYGGWGLSVGFPLGYTYGGCPFLATAYAGWPGYGPYYGGWYGAPYWNAGYHPPFPPYRPPVPIHHHHSLPHPPLPQPLPIGRPITVTAPVVANVTARAPVVAEPFNPKAAPVRVALRRPKAPAATHAKAAARIVAQHQAGASASTWAHFDAARKTNIAAALKTAETRAATAALDQSPAHGVAHSQPQAGDPTTASWDRFAQTRGAVVAPPMTGVRTIGTGTARAGMPYGAFQQRMPVERMPAGRGAMSARPAGGGARSGGGGRPHP